MGLGLGFGGFRVSVLGLGGLGIGFWGFRDFSGFGFCSLGFRVSGLGLGLGFLWIGCLGFGSLGFGV